MTTALKVSVLMGNNRIRGENVGPLLDDFADDSACRLRDVLRAEARRADLDPTPQWLAATIRTLLDLYAKAHAAWEGDRQGCVGHVYEAKLPSGQVLLLGDRRVLARLS